MGAGYHGGFGATSGSKISTAVSASPSFVAPRDKDNLARFASRMEKEAGFTDVIIHGTSTSADYYLNGRWVKLDQRSLALMLKKDPGYNSGNIRLVSCSTGALDTGFAQNLANKLGVTVKAPTDTVWVWPNGGLTVGPSQMQNTGSWRIFKPKKKGE